MNLKAIEAETRIINASKTTNTKVHGLMKPSLINEDLKCSCY